MNSIGIGVNAFVVDGDKILLLKRRDNDPHNPGSWDIPGGRIDLSEQLEAALKREIMEETGLNVEISVPFEAHTFTRDDGQFIIMISYACKLSGQQKIKLSEEHTSFEWVNVDEVASRAHWLPPLVENFKKIRVGF